MSETLSQMVERLILDHGWDRYTAIRAAEYYRNEITWQQLCVALGVEKAKQIGLMR